MINPDELTGESVENFRLERKMKRQAFNDICVQFGLNAGRSLARMCNIEKNDIWKPGDREAVAAAINHISANVELPLTSPERKPRKSKNNSSTLTDDSVIVPVWCDEDDDVDESLVDVLGPDVEAANNNALLGVASWNVDGPVAPDATPITIVNDDDEDLTSWAALEFDGVSSEVDADADERAFVVTNSLIQNCGSP